MSIKSSETWQCDLCRKMTVTGVNPLSPPEGWVKTEVSRYMEERAWDTVIACPTCVKEAVEEKYSKRASAANNPNAM